MSGVRELLNRILMEHAMPQATDEQRKAWGGEGGVGEDKAITFLESRGFRLTPDFTWRKPRQSYELDKDELSAISFLVEEWDYGGTSNERP